MFYFKVATFVMKANRILSLLILHCKKKEGKNTHPKQTNYITNKYIKREREKEKIITKNMFIVYKIS